jgi:RNA polymerase sigma-70 factor (ECF subfamily)
MSDVLYRIQFANDQLAFKELYEKKFFKLFQFALAFVKSQLVAEEIVNDIFLKLWNKRNKLNTIENIDVYLYVTVKNASLNFLRRPEKKHVPIDEIEIEYLHVNVDPASVLITSELRKIIERAVNSLPPRCRLVFKLIKEDAKQQEGRLLRQRHWEYAFGGTAARWEYRGRVQRQQLYHDVPDGYHFAAGHDHLEKAIPRHRSAQRGLGQDKACALVRQRP